MKKWRRDYWIEEELWSLDSDANLQKLRFDPAYRRRYIKNLGEAAFG